MRICIRNEFFVFVFLLGQEMSSLAPFSDEHRLSACQEASNNKGAAICTQLRTRFISY